MLLILAGMVTAVSNANAVQHDEEWLAVPSADIEAAAKDYDHFFRVIRWSKRDESVALRIYFSHRTETLPERGFVLLKIREGHGEFHEGARALTEVEAKKICDLLDHAEIFSLPAKQQFRPELDAYDPGSGPGYDSFVHIDKTRHSKEEITRAPELSDPAAHLCADLAEILGDYLEVVERGEQAVAESKAEQEKWAAEIPASHTMVISVLNEATELEVEGLAFGGFTKDLKEISTDLHFTTKKRESIREIHHVLAGVKFRPLSVNPGASGSVYYLRFAATTLDGSKLIFHAVGEELRVSGLRASGADDPPFWPRLHKALLRARDGGKSKQ